MNEIARRSIAEVTEALAGATHETRFGILEGYIERSYDRLPEWAEPMDGDVIAVLPGDAVLAYGAEHDCGRDRDGDRILLRDVLVYTDEDTYTVVSSATDVDAATQEAWEGMADGLQAERERGEDDAGHVSGPSEYDRNDAGEWRHFM